MKITKNPKGTSFIELCKITVGKEATIQILNDSKSDFYESDNELDLDDDDLTEDQMKYVNEMLDKFKK